MREEITKLPKGEAEEVLKLPNSYYEKGLEVGIEKGIEKGIEQLVTEMLLKGAPEDWVADIAKLDIEKVKEMKRKLKKLF